MGTESGPTLRMQDRLFHVAREPLPPGHVLRPYALARDCREHLETLVRARADGGLEALTQLLASERWYRVGWQGRYPIQLVVLEAGFEWIRAAVAPAAPSRLSSVFAWECMTLALWFRDTYQPSGAIHRCRVASGQRVTRDSALVVAAYEAADLTNPTVDDLAYLEQHATSYWRGAGAMQVPEILVQGTVVVDTTLDTEEM